MLGINTPFHKMRRSDYQFISMLQILFSKTNFKGIKSSLFVSNLFKCLSSKRTKTQIDLLIVGFQVFILKKKKQHHHHHQNAFHPAYTVSVFYPFPLATRIPTQLPEHAAWGLCFLFRVSPWFTPTNFHYELTSEM